MTRHSRKWKEAQVQELKQLADSYTVIAVASLKNFPGALAKQLRKKLQGKAVIKVCKTRVIQKALLQSKADSKELEEQVIGSVALIFSEMDCFELYSLLKKNKVSMPAKAGTVAPEDIAVPAGDTGLPPGPALSDLKAAGLKTVIQGPTILIAEDKVVTKKGEVVSAQVAGTLSKLAIKPVKVGLNVIACLQKGQLFHAKVLDIDAEQVKQQFVQAHRNAFNIAVKAGYFTKETVEAMLSKAFSNAKAVALEANLLTNATVAAVLAKASAQAAALKAKTAEKASKAEKEPAKEAKGEKPEEKPAKETKKEKQPEKEEKNG